MIRNFQFFLVFLIAFQGIAQIPLSQVARKNLHFPNEVTELSINSNLLLAGELLQYKGYVLTSEKKLSQLSKVLYVSLRSDKDSIVFHNLLKVENGIANGDFFIPSSLKTGVYRLIAYTNFSRNNSVDPISEKQLFIINTFVKNKTESKKELENETQIAVNFSQRKENEKRTMDSESPLITAWFDKEIYGKREKVTLRLTALDTLASGNYSISVRKLAPIKIVKDQLENAKVVYDSVFYPPELRGNLISGIVKSAQDNKPITNKEVAFSLPGKNFVFKTSKTNNNGQFFIALNSPVEDSKAIIQVFRNAKESNKFKIELIENKLELKLGDNYKLTIDRRLENWLQQRSTYLQIENTYFEVKKDSVLADATKPIFFGRLGVNYNLDDFTRFPTVKETFTEVISLAAIRGEENNAKFIIYNPYDPNNIANFNNLSPLVLVDGILLQNTGDLISYSANKIQSICVVNTPYRYGSKIYSGIIAVKTKNGDFRPVINNESSKWFSIDNWIKKKKYHSPDYSENNLQRIPDYRVQLLWQPNVELRKEYIETFYTSDVVGAYEIIVHGLSRSGKFLSKSFKIIIE